MKFRKLNNITGLAIGFIASMVYILTREANGSFWDCGEFVSSAYKMQNPHPPGAPLFTLLGRFFIILFGDSSSNAANAVNFMSALASGATILFLFWTITHFGRKMFVRVEEEPSFQQTIAILSAGVIGSLAYTFSDSFWFSAVEGEVYALSSLFTALVFWAMLKWEHAADKAGVDIGAQNRADRWIVFIFFMMGLSIGVHLLNLLTIPAIVMIYYFKRYNYTLKSAIIAFIIGCLVVGVVQVVVIQWSIKMAGKFDVMFVNSLNLPFFSGFIFFFVLLGVLVYFGLRWAKNRGWSFLRLGLWCFVFMMLGYSTYVTSLIRSNANTAIDMNNVDNPMSLVYWLGREQYGAAPILFGPHFQAEYQRDATGYPVLKEGEMKYQKGKNKYIALGRDREPTYESSDMQLFPRVWDPSNDQGHADFYQQWLNLDAIRARDVSRITAIQYPSNIQTMNQQGKTDNYFIEDGYKIKVQQGQVVNAGEELAIKDPGYLDNLNWFITYQNGLMYWRYFMWNFAGKQNDLQGYGNKRDGNWISGIPFIDNVRLGDQTKMPDSLKNNKAHNKLYMLPFILGILGCVFHYFRHRKDWIVTFLLFFFTGLAIVIYLNQPGNQPRERDYAYVGSFYAFAIWIGLAVIALFKLAKEKTEKTIFTNTLLFGSILTFLITLLSGVWGPGAFLSSVAATALYAIVVAALTFILRAVGKSDMILNVTAGVLCLVVPVIMGQQEWDDHDRSQKTLAPDLAKDYLESCAPNAILFTFGDNDTYPLWYAQEVQGVRPDIRIINNSLLGIDWYINQLRYKINQSDSIDVIWQPEQIENHSREYMSYQASQSINPNEFFDLYTVMKQLGNPVIDPESGRDAGPRSYPVRKFKIPVDIDEVRKNHMVNPGDSVLSEVRFELPGNRGALLRSDFMILNIIAANHWKRPIYFTAPYGELGFGQYLRKDGLSYRLVPAQLDYPQENWVIDRALRDNRIGATSIRPNNSDFMYDAMMNRFGFGGANRPGVYYDEENRRHLLNIRGTYGEAAGNLADKGQLDKAKEMMAKVENGISPENLPYAMASRYGNSHNQTGLLYLEAAYKVGDKALANKIKADIRKDLEQQKAYFEYLRSEREDLYSSFPTYESLIIDILLEITGEIEKKYDPQAVTTPAVESGGGTIINSAADSTKKDSSQ